MIGFITGMPRSRTYWLAQYFDGLPGVRCYHEALNGCRSRQGFYDRMERDDYAVVINADSGLCITDFQERWPDAPTVVIHRDIDDVYRSLCAAMARDGYPQPSYEFLKSQMRAICHLNGLHLPFESINCHLRDMHTLFGVPYDPEYAVEMMNTNLQLPRIEADVESYLLWAEGA